MPIVITIVFIAIIWLAAVLKEVKSYKVLKEQINLSNNFNFVESKRVVTNDDNHMICIDVENQKWSYYNATNQFSQIFDFTQLIDYKILENGNSIIQGRTGSTIIGGALFGGIGALAGASRSRKINETCSELKLEIFVDDLSTSCISILLIDKEVKKDHTDYKNAIDKLIEFESVLKVIISNADNIDVNYKEESNQSSIKKQLEELKEMLDDGLITQEDYDKKKKQILGL